VCHSSELHVVRLWRLCDDFRGRMRVRGTYRIHARPSVHVASQLLRAVADEDAVWRLLCRLWAWLGSGCDASPSAA